MMRRIVRWHRRFCGPWTVPMLWVIYAVAVVFQAYLLAHGP